MKWNEYQAAYDAVLSGENKLSPYDQAEFQEYVKLNNARQNRWIKKMALESELRDALIKIKNPQKWILLTEPWCGDAAHISPFINAMADHSDKIDFEIQLRDSAPHLINDYLTNGGKAIPKLIIRDENDRDLLTWGPRPQECQNLMLSLKETDLSAAEKKAELQKWYNKDKGKSIQAEFTELLAQFA